jgi:A118 family predicted phage portal protein
VDGDTSTESDVYHEINPTLNTDTRLTGINALLSQIGYKIGFSNGYFVFNEQSGIQTATGVEADQQRTIQFIKDVRDKLEDCLGSLIYALDVFATLYGQAPAGTYEVAFDFGDITYNREEDRVRWWGYVQAGRVPAWMYFTKFEGMPEDEARKMTEEAQPKMTTLFGGVG